ncbi:MAG TPA: phospholipase D-like domain-containing protein [Myxococcota bacterium]|nr:phospholipase D-like domain-containing protein [Myxococcota bacterium]
MRLSIPKAVGLLLAGVAATLLVLNAGTDDEDAIGQPIVHRYAVSDPQFPRAMAALLGPGLPDGNRIETLVNGDEIFPAMLAAIRSAERTITFETYVYWSGEVGREFADALSERARAGVRVHILLDWLGTQKMDAELLEQMERAGAVIRKYHPIRWYTLDRINNRTHRKILVVDGRVGFTGGVGIADEWSGDAQDPDHWRDTHYRVEGPAVAHMQAAFNDNWLKVSGEVLHGGEYLPPLAAAGSMRAQMFHSSPQGGSETMHLMYLMSVAAAERSIDLAMAYFVPDDLALGAIQAALRRGVRVRIILPGPHIDADAVRHASRALWGDILAAGAEIHEFQPTMYHCKVLVVDGLWTSVGSTNFDNRSFRLNDEANLNVYDRDFAARQLAEFERDLARSRRVTHEEWAARPWTERALELVPALIRSQL